MPVDYQDAAKRHWEDANYLFQDNRLANADHLFGLAAECALKAIMQTCGVLQNNRPGDPHRVHINKMWQVFTSFASSYGGNLPVASLIPSNNPFDNWAIGQRYDNRTDFDQSIVQKHQEAAQITIRVMDAVEEYETIN